MYLFDTDAITNILKKRPSKKIVSKLTNLNRDCQFLSTISIGEIVYGAFKSSKPNHYLNNLKNILLPLINILPFDHKSAYIYGMIRAKLESRGESLPTADVQVASIAIANDLTLVTGNINHFNRISNLKIEDWIN